jgi:hypothetical protein
VPDTSSLISAGDLIADESCNGSSYGDCGDSASTCWSSIAVVVAIIAEIKKYTIDGKRGDGKRRDGKNNCWGV